MNPTPSSRRPLARRAALVLVAATALLIGAIGQASAVTFEPERIISNDNMRDYDSMSASDIQAFLETLPGPLKDLEARDYDKVITLSQKYNNKNITPDKGEPKKKASLIIWEACQAWKINPKVMLTMLQKEQSLLTRTTLGETTLARAVGAGCPGSLVFPSTNKVATNRYPGFGNQVWHGARLLDSYGEGNVNAPTFYNGIKWNIYKIDGMTHIHPSNLATFKLYVYNPSIGVSKPYGDLSGKSCSGNANFWKIYRRYFGSTYADPRMKRVFRFRHRGNGTYLYTTSQTERYHLQEKHKKTWAYGGASFSVDTSVTTGTIPVYRFKNKTTGKYSFTRDPKKYEYRRSTEGQKTWAYGGIAFQVRGVETSGSVPVYRMRNKKTGADLLTSSSSLVSKLTKTAALRKTWSNAGVTFHLPRYSEPATPTP